MKKLFEVAPVSDGTLPKALGGSWTLLDAPGASCKLLDTPARSLRALQNLEAVNGLGVRAWLSEVVVEDG